MALLIFLQKEKAHLGSTGAETCMPRTIDLRPHAVPCRRIPRFLLQYSGTLSEWQPRRGSLFIFHGLAAVKGLGGYFAPPPTPPHPTHPIFDMIQYKLWFDVIWIFVTFWRLWLEIWDIFSFGIFGWLYDVMFVFFLIEIGPPGSKLWICQHFDI